MVLQQDFEKVGRNVYGSGDTIVTKTSHFFQGLTLGAEGGACTRYCTVLVNTSFSNGSRFLNWKI